MFDGCTYKREREGEGEIDPADSPLPKDALAAATNEDWLPIELASGGAREILVNAAYSSCGCCCTSFQ